MNAFFAELGQHLVRHGAMELFKKFPIIPKILWGVFGIALVCGLVSAFI
jgi:hypothetical protein